MASAPAQIIKAQQLTPKAYSAYGEVIAALDDRPFKPANFATAKRFNFLADVENLRPQNARLNLCVFRCSAFKQTELTIKMLEKHPQSTQVFMPMQNGRYLTIVAQGGDNPDMATLAAFICEAPQGVSYRPGIWHYPMTALGEALDLSCLVFENGQDDDCIVADLSEPVVIRF